jgi:hypothetical protein
MRRLDLVNFKYLLKEDVRLRRWMAVLLVACGVVLLQAAIYAAFSVSSFVAKPIFNPKGRPDRISSLVVSSVK